MKSRLIAELSPQVKHNCNVSDANYWGYYSICGLLLRLRELYRTEHGIKPWEPADEKAVISWVGEREQGWQRLQDTEPSPLELDGTTYGAFDAGQINEVLVTEGLVYGAGLGLYGKPVFFLADLGSKSVMEGIEVIVAGAEHARDLSDHPAMLQGKTIFARRKRAESIIWDKLQEFRAGKKCQWLEVAFPAYGVSEPDIPVPELETVLGRIAEGEVLTYIHHEIGEAFETGLSGNRWADMLLSTIQNRAAVYLRALKDTLADASPHGMLRHIISERKTGSLAFYLASLTGYRRSIACGMPSAFDSFLKSRDWETIERERSGLYDKCCCEAETMIAAYTEERNAGALVKEVEKRLTLMQPR